MAHRLDLIQFQLKEIHDANLQLNEDEELQDEKRKLMNFEKLFEALQTSYDSMQGERKGMDWAGLAMSHLETAAEVDSQYGKTLESVSESPTIFLKMPPIKSGENWISWNLSRIGWI